MSTARVWPATPALGDVYLRAGEMACPPSSTATTTAFGRSSRSHGPPFGRSRATDSLPGIGAFWYNPHS